MSNEQNIWLDKNENEDHLDEIEYFDVGRNENEPILNFVG